MQENGCERPGRHLTFDTRAGEIIMTSDPRNIRKLFAALAAAACLVAPAAAQDKVKVGVFPVSSTLPYFVAGERGFFKEQNIETEMVRLIAGHPTSRP
jgi:ABC-type nitrate/sulfonate/bicarbonate transport system substrate-binding protein